MNPDSRWRTRRLIAGCLLAAVGAVPGGVGIRLLTDWIFALTLPQVRHDGQYALIFLYVVPFDALIGAALGFCLPYWCSRPPPGWDE